MSETPLQALAKLERREVITTNPKDRLTCCGIVRDEDGFCQHRPYHPVYVGVVEPKGEFPGIGSPRWAGQEDEYDEAY